MTAVQFDVSLFLHREAHCSNEPTIKLDSQYLEYMSDIAFQ